MKIDSEISTRWDGLQYKIIDAPHMYCIEQTLEARFQPIVPRTMLQSAIR